MGRGGRKREGDNGREREGERGRDRGAWGEEEGKERERER